MNYRRHEASARLKPMSSMPLLSDIQPGDVRNETDWNLAGHFETRTPRLDMKPTGRLAFKYKGDGTIETEAWSAQ